MGKGIYALVAIIRTEGQESRKPLTREQKARYGERFRKQQNLLYKERLRSGICTRCGKRKATNGYVTCAICRNKNADLKRVRSKTSPRSERVQNGLCYFCDNPVKTGYKVCEKHYQMSVENVKKKEGNIKPHKGVFETQRRLTRKPE